MPATYSINVGSQLEAYRKADILSVLKGIPDNTNKLISPKNVRDAFLSTWANSPLKQTTNLAGIEYIGIDSGNPSDRDIKQKIFLGKRTYANLDIMTDTLLSNERADIYIFVTYAANEKKVTIKSRMGGKFIDGLLVDPLRERFIGKRACILQERGYNNDVGYLQSISELIKRSK